GGGGWGGGGVPCHVLFTFPLLLGWFGPHGRFTRGDERAYAGPRIAADGRWLLQDRDSLRSEKNGTAAVDPAVAAAAAARAVAIVGADGNLLRAYRVEAAHEPPRAVVLLVHGLFRSALELETPASMFRLLGCEWRLLEQAG